MTENSTTIRVGDKEVSFSEREIRGSFRMLTPTDFAEDKNLVSNYTYLFSRDQSPLSIAIRFTPASALEEDERQIAVYFSKATDVELNRDYPCPVRCRETVTDSKYMSIYSLRFVVEVTGGLLFGCFNCAAATKDDWRPVVLKMLGETKAV
jgi:hypothetical protein